MERKFEIPENLLTGIVNYLVLKPYNEVIHLINAIQTQCKLIDNPQNVGTLPKNIPTPGNFDGPVN